MHDSWASSKLLIKYIYLFLYILYKRLLFILIIIYLKIFFF